MCQNMSSELNSFSQFSEEGIELANGYEDYPDPYVIVVLSQLWKNGLKNIILYPWWPDDDALAPRFQQEFVIFLMIFGGFLEDFLEDFFEYFWRIYWNILTTSFTNKILMQRLGGFSLHPRNICTIPGIWQIPAAPKLRSENHGYVSQLFPFRI